MKRMLTSAAATVATASLALVGCGSGDDAGAELNTGSQLEGDPIVIGTIGSFSGTGSESLVVAKQTAEAWASWTNANGGINGHPVKLIVEDDGVNPATALQAAKKLVEKDKVMAIVGETSLLDANWASYVSDQGVPVVGGMASQSSFSTDPNFYTSGSSVQVMATGLVLEMKEQDLSSLGVLYCAESPVCAQLVDLAEGSVAVSGGGEVNGGEVGASDPKFTAQCAAMKEAGADTIWYGASAPVALRVVDECFKMGYQPEQLGLVTSFARNWLADPNFENATLIGPNVNYEDTTIPAVRDFQDALDEYFPGVTDSDQFSFASFFPLVGGQLFTAAAEAGDLSPTSSPDDVKAALYSLEDETLDGLAPPLNFTEGEPGFPTCYFPMVITDGELASLGTEPQCLDEEQAASLAP